jgi:Cas7 group CRISPR-associated protein Csh2
MSTTNSSQQTMVRATGLLVIEVMNSNPNGDPDRESDPRQRPDGRGEISPVSFKRKVRDLVEDKQGPVWNALQQELGLPDNQFHILESRGRKRPEIVQEIKEGLFTQKYWDGRVFGNTFLEEEVRDAMRTGVVQFGLGLSVAPIDIERQTMTNKSGVEEGKDRGMAPLGYRIVRHGVYVMPFFVNPSAAPKSGCTRLDIELLLRLIPYAYPHSRSYVRPAVEIRHAWYIEHRSALGSCSDFALLQALTPRKKNSPELASAGWEDYQVPTKLPTELAGKVASVRDLMEV